MHLPEGRILGRRPADIVGWAVLAAAAILCPPDLSYLAFLSGPIYDASPNLPGLVVSAVSLLVVLASVAVDVLGSEVAAGRAKGVAVAALAVGHLALPAVSDSLARRDLGLVRDGRRISVAHDGGVLQTEAAADLLLEGISPYSADYGDTAMAKGVDSDPRLWRSLGYERNPALSFFPYPPLSFAAAAPLAAAWKACFDWYDQRILHLAVLALLGLALWRLPLAAPGRRFCLAAVVLLDPLWIGPFAAGNNDVLWLTAAAWALGLAAAGRHRTSALTAGIACGFKQLAWPLVPLILAYLWSSSAAPRARAFSRSAWPLAAVLVAIFAPFLLWDPGGLLYGTWAQASIYPMREGGLGAGAILLSLGALDGPRNDFPLYLGQALVTLPICAAGVVAALRRGEVRTATAWAAAAILSTLFFSRHFAQSHAGPAISMAAMALLAGRGLPRAQGKGGTPQGNELHSRVSIQ